MTTEQGAFDPTGLFTDAAEYWQDFWQRSILFTDILRVRGNHFIETAHKGARPVLVFDYEILMDGRSLERPVNHDLVRILPEKGTITDPEKRPIVVIDPRAGHGPGIGGSKIDSEIGVALSAGHPVYFILFYPDPEPNQTYSDVKAAQIRFIEELKQRHPLAAEPAIIGNCQAGWAVALLSADRPDVTGPLVLNGSPLSYWAGVEGKNPMRYRGGLLGGIWLASLLSDLGNGKYDGANLVMNFEDLNPANTYWGKQYNVWANVDTEKERYLSFEKWWNSYFMMTADEIRFILENLFVGNRLEKGEVKLDGERRIDLKNLEDPVIVFASSGDNITPPQQALNWIAKVYGSVDEIRRCGQVIIYRVHEKIGHLGIFVSSGVARKEHKEFIRNIDTIEYLPPGLYEMMITEIDTPVGDPGERLSVQNYNIRFKSRNMSDILAYDDTLEDEEPFQTVADISDINDRIYRAMIQPLVKAWANPYTAHMMKTLHPMRASRYLFSDWNPFLLPTKEIAPKVREFRTPVSDDNLFLGAERALSESITAMFDAYRDIRDARYELLFNMTYDNPLTESLTGLWNLFQSKSVESSSDLAQMKAEEIQKTGDREDRYEAERLRWIEAARIGGVPEGIVRVMLMMAGSDLVYDEREFDTAKKIIRKNSRFLTLRNDRIKQMVKDQARILQADENIAVAALAELLPETEDRVEAMEIAEEIAKADLVVVKEEIAVMERLKQVLGL